MSADRPPAFTAEEIERARAYTHPLYLVWPVRIVNVLELNQQLDQLQLP